MRKLLFFIAMGAAIYYVVRKRRASTWPGTAAEVGAAAAAAGLASVDPVGLSGMGEGIDPEAVAAAHEAIPAQRERLPVK